MGCSECKRAERTARAAQIASSVHQLDSGRWIIAEWSARNCQWTGYSPDGERECGQGYRYSFARTLKGLASVGVTTYATRAGALKALEPSERVQSAMCRECRRAMSEALSKEWEQECEESRARAEQEAEEEALAWHAEGERVAEANDTKAFLAEVALEADRAEQRAQAAEKARTEALLAHFWTSVKPGDTFRSINGCVIDTIKQDEGLVVVRTTTGKLRTMRPYAWSYTIGFRAEAAQ